MQNATFSPSTQLSNVKMAFLAAASVAISLGFACVAPLVAFGVFAALTFDRKRAVISILAVWLANQAVGYLVLGYPTTTNSFAWGAVIGLASVAATVSASFLSSQLKRLPYAATATVGFLASFAIYEMVLFVAASIFLGGTETFSLSIISRLFLTNSAVMAALLLLDAMSIRRGVNETPEDMGHARTA